MKVIHSIQFEEQELLDLFELARSVGEVEADTTTYTEADKQEAIADYSKQFKSLLAQYGHDCFALGYSEGAKTAMSPKVSSLVAPSY